MRRSTASLDGVSEPRGAELRLDPEHGEALVNFSLDQASQETKREKVGAASMSDPKDKEIESDFKSRHEAAAGFRGTVACPAQNHALLMIIAQAVIC